ncbi:MAG: patatin [Chloroflexi bacterium]|nr:MAG: patatin [Chloroflexota bacterium]MBL1195989.1 patatin [Chloroflexota bacterium]NOH13283.1 patatin [Chloroflexota bacterium]
MSFKILSLDGGGIRGLISALILDEIERRTGQPIASLFDLIAGTSTGGLLALGLTKRSPSNPQVPQLSAADLELLYVEEGNKIFHAPFWHKLFSLGNLVNEKYPQEGVDLALEKFLGDAMLKDVLTDVVITSYDIHHRRAWFFRSANAKMDPMYDFPLVEVGRATSAAPTYFEPQLIEKGGKAFSLVDGGVYANNPAMCAYADAINMDVRPDDIVMVSIGTGTSGDQAAMGYKHSDAKDWGLIGWAVPILTMVMESLSDTVEYQLGRILPPQQYFRLQARLTWANAELDDVSPQNLAALKADAQDYVIRASEYIDQVCETITK